MQGSLTLSPVMDYKEPTNFTENQAGNTGKYGYDIRGNAPPPKGAPASIDGPLPEIGTSINFGEFRPADSRQGRQQNFDMGRRSGKAEGEPTPGEATAGEAATGEAGAAAGGLEDLAALALL